MPPPQSPAPSLRAAFVGGLSPSIAQSLKNDPQLDSVLAELTESARLAWPEVDLPASIFLAHWASRIEVPVDSALELNAYDTESLYLVTGCLQSNAAALEAFEARYLAPLKRILQSMRLSVDEVQDVSQELRVLLLVSTDDKPGKLATYSGRGGLAGWLRVSAVRLGVRRTQKRVSIEESHALEVALEQDTDVETAYLKRLYGTFFRGALSNALKALSDDDKTLLAQHYIDNVTLEHLAAAHRVHRSTVIRWLARAKERLVADTEQALKAHANLDTAECRSVMRRVRADLDVSVARLLKE
jgi:RNA polymerase sigma-70 factor, ECF subfamily